MSDREIKAWFEKYRRSHSRSVVISDLTGEGLSPCFAERAADGKWNPKRTLQHRVKETMLRIRERRAS